MLNIIKEYATTLVVIVGLVGSTITAYMNYDKVFGNKTILTWVTRQMSVTDGPINDTFYVVTARIKHRDECALQRFTVVVKDSNYQLIPASHNVKVISDPSGDGVSKYAYSFVLDETYYDIISLGTATLTAELEYLCPEGTVFVYYPDGDELQFEILEYDFDLDDPRREYFHDWRR